MESFESQGEKKRRANQRIYGPNPSSAPLGFPCLISMAASASGSFLATPPTSETIKLCFALRCLLVLVSYLYNRTACTAPHIIEPPFYRSSTVAVLSRPISRWPYSGTTMRLSHRKSRLGCQTCKKRKVKVKSRKLQRWRIKR